MPVRFAYQPPRQLADGLWEITGSWKNKLGRRMTVMRLDDGTLVIHNSIQLEETELDWLRSLGTVAFIIGPNTFHCSDADWMHQRFPEARLYVPQKVLPKFPKALDLNSDFPKLNGLLCLPMRGTRMQESAFWHPSTSTLVLTDTAFNMPPVFRGLEKKLMDWNKVGGRFGPSRLTRLLFASDVHALLDSYRRLAQLPLTRIIVNHGDILDQDALNQFHQGINLIFPEIAIPP